MAIPIRPNGPVPPVPPAPPKMVISGSGPTGLACALEAIKKGYRPILLEKRPRDQTGRIQSVFLTQEAVDQLERHGIYSELLNQRLIFPLKDRRCTVRLTDLEQVMRKAIEKATGTPNFIRYNKSIAAINQHEDKANLVLETGEVIEHVDLVVNAEGFRSSTNQLLGNRRVEVLNEKTMVTSILIDDRPEIEGVRTFFEATGKTLRNVAMAVRDHTIYIFLLIFTQEHFNSPSRKIALAAILNTPKQSLVSFAFTEKKLAEIQRLQNDVQMGAASQEKLDDKLQFWGRMALCEVNVASTVEKITRFFLCRCHQPTVFVGASPVPTHSSHLIQVRSDHTENAAIRRGSSLFLITGDAYSTVDPSTGLGCNTGIELAKSVKKAMKQLARGEDLDDISANYGDSCQLLRTRNHLLAQQIRRHFF